MLDAVTRPRQCRCLRRDHDVVRLGLGDARGDDADADLETSRRDARAAVGRLKVVDELREVLDR